ncbi:hypothetical protein A1F96_00955 [Pyrenophora tritici-repentis]|uniref:Uncharacterized protein n=2 Tax=Pyrenophora tritici-repentis TaxID=45151 RepID=A0A2W1E9C8_9PLEO|nr:uncharacterized protein PTRG_11208 [Pyrenophora tritici-repentis Pt-1C-BFP]KAF7575573.1 hypothetical protein PtrM4_071970 [Pyrenophora tritici-repentis]EDU44258.1 hypothetical protein PTRG_11208 [Pyrenophora tritici-repentis Pt-1C-BFP]KAI0575029.1 hypothetical protein Alg215_08262 [Pyrenophora tritici-repentis]KAI1530243.1 hypothetical protein PtrSN001A_008258 [Pyrenophora tritici-repentis]PWO23776.1 tumor susceptibility protein 101 [Pyrenophora tritici-repentis]
MTWWRRDGTVSPIHRYAQRLLRSHEATLRTRYFFRTPSKSAQHGDDGNTKRPMGMSNLEWVQLQHYQRWRKRLMDDPYQAIFGASNDILSGKGLKDWEWISKSFPKWMLREMETHDTTAQLNPDKDNATHPKHPKRVEIRDKEPVPSKERDSHFPQPTFRATRLDREDSSGVVSPSDLRRPREEPYMAPELTLDTESSSNDHQNSTSSQPIPPKSSESFSGYITKTRSDAATKLKKSSKEEPIDKPSFMNQFLMDSSRQEGPFIKDPTRTSTWRETALQRRSLPNITAEPDTEPEMLTSFSNRLPPVVSSNQDTQWSTERAPERLSPKSLAELEVPAAPKSVEPESEVVPVTHPTNDGTSPTRSTSRILSQLPEDDIDLLSAADIRASMGARKSKTIREDQKKVERSHLEKSFVDAHNTRDGIDPMIESNVINDQLVRRLESQMQNRQQPEQPEQPSESLPVPQFESISTGNTGLSKNSTERPMSWLEQGGAVFSSLFWQDPTIEADAEKTRLYCEKVLARIRKGRTTMKQVIEDLESDVPASKPLLKRMKADEDMLDAAINALWQRAITGKLPSLTPRKFKGLHPMRLRIENTDKELKKANAALNDISNSRAVKYASPALKRRLAIAVEITQKNAHLTRYLIWSLQARLEDPGIERTLYPNYKVVVNSLLTLRDTQVALARLLERVMLVYGVSPQTMEDIDKLSQGNAVETPNEHNQIIPRDASPGLNEVDKAQLRAKIAAEERLANEVDAQKSAMRGLSDDGYARVPKLTAKKSFEERGPLAHSLFRPFGPVLESLETEKPVRSEARQAEEALQKANDDQLVAEVKSAYEDTYGPITVGHEQSTQPAAETKISQEPDMRRFDMLKDDPTTISESSACEIVPSPQDMTHTQDVAAVEVTQEVSQDSPVDTQATSAVESAEAALGINEVSDKSELEAPSQPASSPSFTTLPTHYTILIHDPETGKLSLTTSTSEPPRDTSPMVPLHQALATLDQPAKFIPHITDALEIVTAKRDMLILRHALNAATSTKSFETVNTSPAMEETQESEISIERGNINPIDGTTRLSPTGYVSPAESQEQLEKEFAERRLAAERLSSSEGAEQEQQQNEQKSKSRKKGGRGAGVVKTAIWAAALCYVVGVVGEITS